MALQFLRNCVVLILLVQLSSDVISKCRANPALSEEEQRYFEQFINGAQPIAASAGPSSTPTELFKTIAAPTERPISNAPVPTFRVNVTPQVNNYNYATVPQSNNLNTNRVVNVQYTHSPTNPFLGRGGAPVPSSQTQYTVLQPRISVPTFSQPQGAVQVQRQVVTRIPRIPQQLLTPRFSFNNNLANNFPAGSYYRVYEHSYKYDSRINGGKPEEHHYVYDSRNPGRKETFY